MTLLTIGTLALTKSTIWTHYVPANVMMGQAWEMLTRQNASCRSTEAMEVRPYRQKRHRLGPFLCKEGAWHVRPGVQCI